MLSDTLAAGLEAYRIGPKVKALRLRKKLGLVQLGRHTGLSPAMLSKIERGQLFPTLPTLLRIALVFNVGLEHFFSDNAERPAVTVVRKADRVRLPDRPGREAPSYFFESLDFPATDRKMEAFHAEFLPGGKDSETHAHEGAEFLYVLAGGLAVTVDDNEVELGEGDAMYFDPSVPHTYRCASDTACRAIVVVSP